jgi:hypothetical protein
MKDGVELRNAVLAAALKGVAAHADDIPIAINMLRRETWLTAILPPTSKHYASPIVIESTGIT